jgi:DNA repair protein RadC
METLYVCENGAFREASDTHVLRCAHTLVARRFRTSTYVLSHPDKTRDFLRLHTATFDHEVFGLIHLDVRRRLIAVEDLFRGTLDGANVYPREVVKSALRHNTAAVILFHNHPSGSPQPSTADEITTRRLIDALSLVDIRVLDHLIIGEFIFSFAEAGLL